MACDQTLTLTLKLEIPLVLFLSVMSGFTSRALCSIRARYPPNAVSFRSLAPTAYSSKSPPHLLSVTRLISLVSTRPEAVPSAFRHAPDAGRRMTTPSSADASDSLSQHLNQTFAPLKFPPTLAQRILTHISHHDSVIGHSSRFSFLGACGGPCHVIYLCSCLHP